MSNTARYPLIIKGFYSDTNGTNSTLAVPAANTRQQWSNVITKGRGKAVAFDIVGTDRSEPTGSSGVANLTIGSIQVFQNLELSGQAINARPGNYEIRKIRQDGGQNIIYSSLSSATPFCGAILHVYHENQFATKEIIEARNIKTLKPSTQDYSVTVNSNDKNGISKQLTVPTGIGNVVAIAFYAFDDFGGGVLNKSIFSFQVDGTNVIEDAYTGQFYISSTRPQIMPILIRPGSTFQFNNINTVLAPAGQKLTMVVRLYFDDDVAQTKNYQVNGCN